MIDLLSIWLIVWLLKTAAEDVSYALKGTPNPRYEAKRQKALAAGKRAPQQPRYGSRDWFGDLVSDGLAAQTERRRAKATKKAEREERPLDDLAEAVREEPQRPAATRYTCPVCQAELTEVAPDVFEHPDGSPLSRCAESTTMDTEEFPEFQRGDDEEDWCETHQKPRLRQGVWGRGPRSRYCPCSPRLHRESSTLHDSDYYQPTAEPTDTCPDAQIYPFPEMKGSAVASVHEAKTAIDSWAPDCPKCGKRMQSPQFEVTPVDGSIATCHYWCPCGGRKTDRVDVNRPRPRPKAAAQFNIVKEISMATSEVNGLSTAMAFADAAANAHSSFATGGSEGYTGALATFEVGDGCIGSAREAQEASSIAAAKWRKHHEDLAAQLKVKEAYQGSPDAGNKQFLLNG